MDAQLWGSFLFGDTLTRVPPLPIESRAQYLVNKGYTRGGDVGPAVREFLPHVNFHHFLGYARNYGKLTSEGRISLDTSLDAVVKIIETDRQVASLLFQACQSYEHQLRALLVDAHLQLFDAYGCFFEDSHYLVRRANGRSPAAEVVKQTLRMKEPFVVDRLESYMKEHGLSGRPEKMPQVHQASAVQGLAIWAIVDGLTFGTLSDLILHSRSTNAVTGARRVLDAVAEGCGVHKSVFESQLRGLLVLRNQISHHARLWMRPTTQTPAIPSLFKRACRDMHPKSMYIAWLTLSAHLKDAGEGRALQGELDAILDRQPDYRAGVQLPKG